MLAYVVRRILWTVPIFLGIVLITFVLFTYVAPDPARLRVGKDATPEKLAAERAKLRLDKPVWLNRGDFLNTQFFDVLLWRLPKSDRYELELGELIALKAPASLAIQVPVFVVELGLALPLALLGARCRGRWPDYGVTIAAVFGMCLPSLSIIVAAQWLLGFKLGWFPVAGWSSGPQCLYFAVLPIVVGVATNLGGSSRFYRTVLVEEVHQDYVRTARAKGVSERQVLLTHVMRNVMIPVLTNTVTHLPYLVLGALLIERMFQIPGLGYVLVEAIENQDRPVVLGLTMLLSISYCLLLALTDVLYTLADPRVTLQ